MSDSRQGGLLFVLSGPSGVGKDAAIERLKAKGFDAYHAITATTRLPRPNERHGVDYFFYTPEEFTDLLKRNELLESAVVAGNRYGSPRQQVREQLAMGRDVLLKIDVQGARQVKQRVPNAVFIFLAPPSIEELVERLQQRNTETEEQIAERVLNAYVEMEAVESYDYVVVNYQDKLDVAVDQIACIISAERCRVHRRTVEV
ncbi:MAG: gmk, partial [Chloroflexi bacterium]|jgi:guanylate kinase|nr:gmk [Chloroflexota bacterium]